MGRSLDAIMKDLREFDLYSDYQQMLDELDEKISILRGTLEEIQISKYATIPIRQIVREATDRVKES